MAEPRVALTDEELERNFADIAPPLTPDYALLEADRCLFCYDAPCTIACPTHIDVPAFIKKIATGNLRGSARVILAANPFGHSCARACPVEVLCEGACVLNDRDEQPIKIALLQRHATDYVLATKVQLFAAGPRTGKKVAIVGAGPAGLSCARDLRVLGHDVTVFEAQSQPGGLNTYGIAEYKLKHDVALAEVQDILDLGVELRTGVTVGRDLPFDRLFDYDAVFVGIGLGRTRALAIPGADLPGVVDALTFIAHLKTHPYRETGIGKRVVVIGAGNTAIDAVTQAKRLGADQATIVYRRGEADMPCYLYEYELAKRDGCGFRFHAVPRRIIADGSGGIAGVEVQTPQGTETIPCDMVIVAIGQGERAEFAVPRDHPKVFVGGDGANGGAEIVNAAAEGVAAARSIDAMLSARR
ncbi:MAG: NAD(P)-dependent oxidoreductase [Gemmatimonadales bacterium]